VPYCVHESCIDGMDMLQWPRGKWRPARVTDMLGKAGRLGREVENGRSGSPPDTATEAGSGSELHLRRFNVHIGGYTARTLNMHLSTRSASESATACKSSFAERGLHRPTSSPCICFQDQPNHPPSSGYSPGVERAQMASRKTHLQTIDCLL
jgi:hypothetical protein